MKEKIGMEKLIRYLLESKGEEYKEEYYERYRDVELEQNIDSLSELKPFIKWLVENDKIDTDAYKTVYSGDLDKWKTLTMSSGGDEFYQVTEHGVYESLIMLLSISDTPIEDLINYLK